MSAPADVHEPVNVALIGRKDEARDQLQKSLIEFGASVVFEGEPPDVDLGALRRTAPGVVIVNLDAALEDALDSLQSVLDDPAVNVIFNEADVTRQLGGWDLARWARHLAAKVLGHGDTNPPMPANAEALPGTHFMPRPGAPPTPAEMAGERFIEEFTVEADDHADAIPTDYLPMEVLSKADAGDVADLGLGIDFDAIEGAMSLSDAAAPQVASASVPDSQHGADDAPIDFGIDLSVLDAALSAPPLPQSMVAAPAQAPTPATAAAERAVLDSVLGEFNLDLDAPDGDDDGATPFSRFVSEDEEYQPDENVARLAAELDGLADGGNSSGVDALDEFDFSVSAGEAFDAQVPAAGAAEDSLADDGLSLGGIALEEIDAGDADVGTVAAAASASGPVDADARTSPAFDFGSLELAPMDGEAGGDAGVAAAAASGAPAFDFGALDLSLEPMGDESDAADAVDVSGDAIQRVIVLGASIGGPDALRTFLGSIPPGFPALFVLAQHLENGFFERLAQQLQKSSRIPVRVAQAGEQVAHGQVLVVPSDTRMCIEPDGSVASEPHAEAPRYRPCIDDVMHDIADRFGPRATAIVFSGMAGDAIEGSVYLTAKGGEVWAQTPESCVVSSMVDGASARGVVEFFGTPRELADRCVARYGR